MTKILYVTILLSNFLIALVSVPAYAVAPPPKFLLVGSANSCLGATANVTDYTIDRLSGRHWMMTDAKVCYSDDHGVSWTEMTAGGPYTCFPTTGGIHLKRFQTAPDGTIVMFTGTSNCSSGQAAWWLNNVADTPTHRGTTFTESTTPIRSSSIAPWGTTGTVTTADGHWVITMTNSNVPTQAMGIWLSADNGRTFVLPATIPVPGPNGETFGAFGDPNSNVRYVGFGAGMLVCTTWTNLAYTTDNDGANWQMIPYVGNNSPPCADTWTPIVAPPNQGIYAGQGLYIAGPGRQVAPSNTRAWAFGPLSSPTSLTFTDVTGNLFSGNSGTNKSEKPYNTLTVGIDWNYRIFAMSLNWTSAGSPGMAPVWSDTLPTWAQTDTVSGNTLPSFYTSPCTTGTPRPNFCLSMEVVVDKFYNAGANPKYGQVCIPMRTGTLYCTELPQSHLATSASGWTANLSVGIGNTTGPEQVVVNYLDQDTTDPTCPAITGNGTVYPSRAAGTFGSANPSIAVVNSVTGIVTGVAPGVTNPTFTCGGVTFVSPNTITVTASLDAELPRVYIDSTYSLPVDGTTWAAHDVAQFRAALINSVPGDVIVLDAGVTYSGSFTLPAKTNPGNKWIYIISSQLANLPAGTRVSPANAIYMPKIVTPGATGPFTVAYGANYWRLAGLELTAASNYPAGCGTAALHCMTYFLMNIAGTSGALADHIYVDRVYGHGGPLQDLQGGIITNWNNAALVDSYIDDVHIKVYDSVGTGCYRCLGPIKIVNNHISSSSENVMFGGAGGNGNPGVPSDIEIRNNYLYKPLSWVTESVTNNSMAVKNAFQVSSGQRILFDGNVIENVWAHAQVGYAIVLTVRSGQGGDFAVVNDVTITNNVLKNVVAGINTLAEDDTCGPPPGSYPNCHNPGSQDRWNIANNLILFYDPNILGGRRNVVLATSGGLNRLAGNTPGTTRDIVFQHNTAVSAASTPCWNSIYFSSNGQGPPFAVPITNNVWIIDNVLCDHPTGDWGFTGTTGLKNYMGNPSTLPNDFNARFYGNVIWAQPGETVPSYPASDLTQAAPFTYVNPSAMDYQLLTPVWTNTTDGNQAGIDNNYLPNH